MKRIANVFASLSLQVKLTLIFFIPIAVLLVLSGFVGYAQERERALASMSLLASQTGQVIEHALQEDMANSDFTRVQSTIDTIADDDRIRLVYLLDTNGRVVFAPQGEAVGDILDPSSEACQPCHSLPPFERPSGIVTRESDGRRYFRSMHPIENKPECLPCHDPDQRINGLLLTDLPITPVEDALTTDLRKNLIWWSGTALAMIAVVNLGVHRFLVRRVQQLSAAISEFYPGENRPELPESPQDELGLLSNSFIALMERIEQREAENNRLSEALHQRNQERGILLRNLINAQEEERKRVARELHDELGQALSTTALQLEIAKQSMTIEPQKAEKSLEDAHTIIAASTDQISDLIMGLRPSSLDDLGLQAALRAHVDRVLGNAGMRYTLEFETLQKRLPVEVEIVLFRVFQEALTNIVRHSNATQVDLQLKQADGTVMGRIMDNGRGFDPAVDDQSMNGSYRYGLLGMRERVELCGGKIDIHSQTGQGTTIHIEIPIRRDGQDCHD